MTEELIMRQTFYPKTHEELDAIYQEHITDDFDFICSALGTPRSIIKNPAPEGQAKVIDRDGQVNLDPCRIILNLSTTPIQIEVPLEIYDDWMDYQMIKEGLNPRTGNPLQ